MCLLQRPKPESHALPSLLPPHSMQALALRPLQEVWLMVPSISRFQWHPFTVAGGSADGVLTLHVKRYGPFTKVSGWVLSFVARIRVIVKNTAIALL